MEDLKSLSCRHRSGERDRIPAEAVEDYLERVGDWRPGPDGDRIERTFAFGSYYETVAFVNAVAWIAHREDHHPDLEVGYDRVLVRFSTHSVGGLSENDFICAAKIDALL